MTEKTKPAEARVLPKALVGLLQILVLSLLLIGCGGPGQPMPPDMTGIWQGTLDWPDIGEVEMFLDLQQQPEGELAGTARFLTEGDSPEEIGSVPVSQGSVDGEGSFQVVGEIEGETVNVSGEAGGDSMEGTFDIGGPSLDYQATRITEEEYQAYLDERGQDYEADQDREETERDEQLGAMDRYDELAAEAGGLGFDVEQRLRLLVNAPQGSPQEQLQEALGPEDPGGDLYACSLGGASCEVADLEQRLEGDTEDVAEDDGSGMGACEIVDFEYYEEYEGFGDEGGAEYVQVRDDLAGDAEGLGDQARKALEATQQATAAREDYEEAGGNPSPLDYSVEDMQQMVADAEAAEQSVAAAIEEVDARYAEYESRAAQVIDAGLALRGQAGC